MQHSSDRWTDCDCRRPCEEFGRSAVLPPPRGPDRFSVLPRTLSEPASCPRPKCRGGRPRPFVFRGLSSPFRSPRTRTQPNNVSLIFAKRGVSRMVLLPAAQCADMQILKKFHRRFESFVDISFLLALFNCLTIAVILFELHCIPYVK